MKIGIVVGSNRKLSNSFGIASWVKNHLANKETQVQIFTPTNAIITTPINFMPPMAIKSSDGYESAEIQAFSRDISSCDGFVFISPVYNHSYTGQFKIMIDHLYHEFSKKPVVLVGHGSRSSMKAVEAMAQLASKYSMNIVGEISLPLPQEYIVTQKRIAHEYDPEGLVDDFLKEHNTSLAEKIQKLKA